MSLPYNFFVSKKQFPIIYHPNKEVVIMQYPYASRRIELITLFFILCLFNVSSSHAQVYIDNEHKVENKEYKKPCPKSQNHLPNGYFSTVKWDLTIGNLFDKFEATYVVPEPPIEPDYNGRFCYWIGINTKHGKPEVLQPILAYNWRYEGRLYPGWSLCAVDCDLEGNVEYSETKITGMSAGETISASITRGDVIHTKTGDKYEYTIKGSYKDQDSILEVEKYGTENFNMALIVLETSLVGSCNQLPNGPFKFKDITITHSNGKSEWPTWGCFIQPCCEGQVRVNSNNKSVTIEVNATRSRWNWEEVDGKEGKRLKHVSVGSDGEVWGVDLENNIYRRKDNSWQPVSGRFNQVTVGGADNIWGVSSNNELFRYQGNNSQGNNPWEHIARLIKYVSAGSDGEVWALTPSDTIFRYKKDSNKWIKVYGNLKQISAADINNIWGVNRENKVYRYQNNKWGPISGKPLKYVSVDSDGKVWGLDPENNIYRRKGNWWQPVPGKLLKQISVGDAAFHKIWGVNKDNDVFHYLGDNKWGYINGKEMKYVSVQKDGTVWGLDPEDNIYRRTPTSWQPVSGHLRQISVGNAKNIWGVNKDNDVYRYQNNSWGHISGNKMKYVSVGSDGTVGAIALDGVVYRRKGDSWQKIEGKAMKQISVGDAKNIWGVDKDGKVYEGIPLQYIGCEEGCE